MSSIATNSEDDYSRYSAYNEADAPSLAVPSATGKNRSHLLNNGKFVDHRVKYRKQQRVYSRDEFLYALSSPSSIGAMAWIISSFMAVIYGSSIVVYLNFCIPLLVGPFVISEQMASQLLPSARKKFNTVRDEANFLVMSNIQLKGTLSRLQRQEYRLSVVEERFEHLCKRSDHDVTKMKHLAKKNAVLRQQIKATLASTKIQKLFTDIFTPDYNGNCVINEKQIDEIVMLMKVIAGKKNSTKFDKDSIHEAVVNSLASNAKMSLAPTSIEDTDNETMVSEREGNDERRVTDAEEDDRRHRAREETEESNSAQHGYKGKDNQNSREEEESMQTSNNGSKSMSLGLDPSGHFSEKKDKTDDFDGMVETSISNGASDEPIDIERLLFSNQRDQSDVNQTYPNQAQPHMTTMTTSVE